LFTNKRIWLVLAALLWCAGILCAQTPPWAGIIDPSRAIDWSGAGVTGGIPSITTQCVTTACAIITAGPPSSITYTQINTAIAGAPSNTYVYLPAGTYILYNTIQILRSNVVLRGAGPDQTFLIFFGSNGCNGNICVLNGNPTWDRSSCIQPGGSCSLNWSAGYTPGTTSITTDKAPPVNNLLILDQADETTDPGTFYTCDVSGVCHPTGEVVGQGRVISDVTYGHTQLVTVQSVSGTGPYTVTISPGLYAQDWRSGQTPGGWFIGVPLTGAGIENLSIDNTNWQALVNVSNASNAVVTWYSGTDFTGCVVGEGTYVNDGWYSIRSCDSTTQITLNGTVSGAPLTHVSFATTNQSGVYLAAAQNSWIKNIRSLKGHRNHIWIYQSSNITVQDSYLYAQYVVGGPTSYGIELWLSSDNLIQNNIMDFGPCVLDGTVQGNIIAYNYFPRSNENVAQSLGGGIVPGHDAGSMYNLFEGNVHDQYWHDFFHGTNGLSTAFRNRIFGWNSYATNATYPFDLYMGIRMENIIGNILGTASWHTNYEDCKVSTGCVDSNLTHSIYVLGFPGFGNAADSGSLVYDRLVRDTLFRWGNYDVVTAAAFPSQKVRWCGNASDPGWTTTCGSASEVPIALANCTICSQATTYSNAVPASTTLPASFYLAAKPSWWGSVPWPAIGPDVTGGNGPDGYSYNIPAQNCYNNSPVDPNYGNGALLFNANNCYGAAPPSVPPGASQNLFQ
jgi:hypothetical protein